jgi:hypothetical protein
MRSKNRPPRPPITAIPPELTEEDGHVYREVIDPLGNTTFVTLSESVLERMSQPRPTPRHRVHHKNGNKLDNRRDNLGWRLFLVGPGSSDN